MPDWMYEALDGSLYDVSEAILHHQIEQRTARLELEVDLLQAI